MQATNPKKYLRYQFENKYEADKSSMSLWKCKNTKKSVVVVSERWFENLFKIPLMQVALDIQALP